MGILDDIFGNDDAKDLKNEVNENETRTEEAKLLLRQEELDISKSRVQTGEVEFGKEIIEEQKIVDVPVLREEIVIERRTLNNEQSDSPITAEETIRIPVSQEKVDVGKRTVITGEVIAHKHDIEETKHIDETLKREEARIKEFGNPDVVDNVSDQQYH
ncbi:YsnF/AvaK domain-containing protein [Desulfosporosinus nitroreducens]|uniref:YsnF/AvaK domain-containing protein n=1 Tax=Desulfosporosinus nitroreducens TaxID=2018668 RepID=A0ABT8QVX5_9FIRM|nr:YsnF/AvaK domain-containing protein [Desulfosporosinus nitroreducens]MCO1603852.1 YsnF/AvaK domain-containing protein [Desulfosporosinus nitroreducens]MDO0825325.1 YsnF/AvaK domain-containing protein [Desulfosporosinus nitroreducens]